MSKAKSKQKPARPKVTVDVAKLDGLIDKAESGPLQKDECSEIKSAIHHLANELARQQNKRKGYRATEKAKELLREFGEKLGDAAKNQEEPDPGKVAENEEPKKKGGGNGRLGAADYVGATNIPVELNEELKSKQPCAGCGKGRLYSLEPSPLIRITGLPPIQARIFWLERTRCNLCGDIHTADAPEGIGEDRYDSSVAAMTVLLKYGCGMPFHRIQTLQNQLGVPLPASTQFGLINDAAKQLAPVHKELVFQAAQGQVVTFDDTVAQILDDVERPEEQGEERTGIKTTGLVAELDDKKIAAFITGPRYAGENVSEFLKQRLEGLEPMVGMADASSQNNPKVPPGVDLLMSACIVHGRRQFVDVFSNFPQECWHVITELGKIYHCDKQCRDQGMDKEARLLHHQRESGPVMEGLKVWMQEQEKSVEPNSGLGTAIKYFLKRWDKLTLFLRHPGSPLDSTIVERALKKAILNRKNSFFFKTQHGAEVADLFMTLIHTCELNQVNPFDYILQLLRHGSKLTASPASWMPWNYTRQLRAP